MENQVISGLSSFLVFQLGSEKFAVNIGYVQKILEMIHITRVPYAPEPYLGVINFFGEILPVMDGRTKFDLKKKEVDTNTCIIVLMAPVSGAIHTIGIVVDQVLQVADITGENMCAPPEIGKKFRFDYICSIAKVKEEFILILNMEKLFDEKDVSLINPNI
ncbi:MAG: chemotaxis protein CheW [Mangrovibacterium sp.]